MKVEADFLGGKIEIDVDMSGLESREEYAELEAIYGDEIISYEEYVERYIWQHVNGELIRRNYKRRKEQQKEEKNN